MHFSIKLNSEYVDAESYSSTALVKKAVKRENLGMMPSSAINLSQVDQSPEHVACQEEEEKVGDIRTTERVRHSTGFRYQF